MAASGTKGLVTLCLLAILYSACLHIMDGAELLTASICIYRGQ